MKIKDTLGITSYMWYGGGFSDGSWTQPTEVRGLDLYTGDKRVSSVQAVYPFKLQRFFVDCWQTVAPTQPVQLMTEPSPQRFWIDSYLKLCKANGIKTDWGVAGLFNWQLDPNTPTSQRKTSIPTNKDPNDFSTWSDLAEYCKQIAAHYNGTGLLDVISILNEFNFKWNVWRVMTHTEYARAFKSCYDAIRSVNQELIISMGGSIGRDINELESFIDELKFLYGADGGKPMPTDWLIDQHWYMRDGSNNQGGGTTGITPEDAGAYSYGLNIDSICEREGLLGWKCGETGWATDNSKQHAPDLEGFTRSEAQGILMCRLALIWGSCKYFKGVEFWHCRDLYDAEPYAYGGVNNKDWSPKPAFNICKEFLEKYGDNEVKKLNKTANGLSVELDNGIILSWSNLRNAGNLTPKPMEIVDDGTAPPPPPPPPTGGNMIIGYSTQSDRSDFKEIGQSLPIGSYYVEARNAVAPVMFSLKKDGVLIHSKTENGAPYDLHGGQAGSFAQGVYELTVTDKANLPKVITFNVGSVQPPPPPPTDPRKIQAKIIIDNVEYSGELKETI